MSQWNTSEQGSDVKSRREFVTGVGAAAVPLVAGCLGGDDETARGMHDILIRNEDSREQTITVEVTNFDDRQRDEETPQPEHIVWERDFTRTVMSGDRAVEPDIFTDSGWNHIRISLEGGYSVEDWVNGCYYFIRIYASDEVTMSDDTSSC